MIVQSKGGIKFDVCDICHHLMRRVATKCDCCTAKDTQHRNHHENDTY